MTAGGHAVLPGLVGALKLGVLWALLAPLVALAAAASFGTLVGGRWATAMQLFLHTIFYAILCSSWPAIFGDRKAPDYRQVVRNVLMIGAAVGALVGVGVVGLHVALELNAENHSLHETLRRALDVLTGQMLALEPSSDARTMNVWYYVKMLGCLGVVAGAVHEPVGTLWNRLQLRRSPPR